jgi:hypothetical protein
VQPVGPTLAVAARSQDWRWRLLRLGIPSNGLLVSATTGYRKERRVGGRGRAPATSDSGRLWCLHILVMVPNSYLPSKRLREGERRVDSNYGALNSVMSWAVAVAGRTDLGAILLLVPERDEAEAIASEMRCNGHHVDVQPFPDRGPQATPSDKARQLPTQVYSLSDASPRDQRRTGAESPVPADWPSYRVAKAGHHVERSPPGRWERLFSLGGTTMPKTRPGMAASSPHRWRTSSRT